MDSGILMEKTCSASPFGRRSPRISRNADGKKRKTLIDARGNFRQYSQLHMQDRMIWGQGMQEAMQKRRQGAWLRSSSA